MQIQQLNLQLVDVLNEWDPFEVGEGNYVTEIADTVQAVHAMDDKETLARMIQDIYEFSFEKMISLENCEVVAAKLLAIKNSGTCAL